MSLPYIAAVGSMFPGVTSAAMLAEETHTYGVAAGLSEDETVEVIQAWVNWYRTVPYALDWSRVRRALIARAHDESWRP